jgi:ElaB/YqjD/DUF883 family membrane-anchored ribosome-binding protein
MTKIPVSAYIFVVQQDFQRFKYNFDGNHIPNDKASFMDPLQRMMQSVESDMARAQQRPIAKVSVHLDTRGPAHLRRHVADEVKRDVLGRPKPNPQQNHCLPLKNRYNIGFVTGRTGLRLFGDMTHEAEHAAQIHSPLYNSTQRKLIAVSNLCYDRAQPGMSDAELRQVDINYRNNYSELCARLAEADVYIQAYQLLKEIAPEQLIQQATINAYDEIVRMMRTDVSIDAALALNERNVGLISDENYRIKALSKFFPESTKSSLRNDVQEFLQTAAPALYSIAIIAIQEKADILSQILQELKQTRQEVIEAKQAKQAQEFNQKILATAQAAHVPVLFQMPEHAPYGQEWLYPANLEGLLLSPKGKQYSPAVVCEAGKTPMFIYDHSPIPRPYSTSPALRTQWEAEHPEEQDADMKIYTRDVDEPR